MLKSLRSLGIMCALAVTVAITGCSDKDVLYTKVTDAEVGIRTTFSGEIEDKVLDQGFHQVLVGEVLKVSKRNLVIPVSASPMVVEKVPMQVFAIKVNYGIVPINAAVAYKEEKAQHMTTKDGDVYLLGEYVKTVAGSAINDVVSKYKALEVNDNRTKIETELRDAINTKLKAANKERFVRVNEINIMQVQPPQSIINSSMAIVNSENALKTKNNELEVAKTETQIKKVLAENASNQYIDLQRAEAELTKAQALKIAAEKGTLNTMVIVPEKFTGIGQVK